MNILTMNEEAAEPFASDHGLVGRRLETASKLESAPASINFWTTRGTKRLSLQRHTKGYMSTKGHKDIIIPISMW